MNHGNVLMFYEGTTAIDIEYHNVVAATDLVTFEYLLPSG